MIANDSQTVLDLNNRARADRVGRRSQRRGVETASGSVVGVGDSVVTRRNQRGLATGRGWVKNGDQWTVFGLCMATARSMFGESTGRGGRPCPPPTFASMWSSATPPPPTAPKAAPSTPPTRSSQPPRCASRCT